MRYQENRDGQFSYRGKLAISHKKHQHFQKVALVWRVLAQATLHQLRAVHHGLGGETIAGETELGTEAGGNEGSCRMKSMIRDTHLDPAIYLGMLSKVKCQGLDPYQIDRWLDPLDLVWAPGARHLDAALEDSAARTTSRPRTRTSTPGEVTQEVESSPDSDVHFVCPLLGPRVTPFYQLVWDQLFDTFCQLLGRVLLK